MKTLKTLVIALIAITLFTNAKAQTCFGLDENDFPQTCVSTEGTAPTTATFDYDYVTGSAATGYTGGADGTDDVTVSMTATCNQPNGTNGSTYVAACLGPDGLDSQHNGANPACGGTGLGINIPGGSDFGGATCDDQPCTVCYVEVCYDFINGYTSEAAGFDAVWSSMNGSTEGYEAIVGWVEGTDNAGAALPANGTTTAGLNSWCHADVVAGTLPVNAIFGAAPPVGTFSADAITGDGVATACPEEEPASSSGPDSGGSATGVAGANLGLNADDIITRMCVVYILSNNNADDCDGDGETNVNTNPSGSFASVDICPPAVEVLVECGACTEGAAGLVITELSYDPSGTQGNDGDCEYIELFNSYSNTITLDANTTLELSNGASFTFPMGTTIAPGEYIIIAIDPVDFGTCTWTTPPPAGTQIFGPTSGSLSNSGESVDITLACATNAAVDFTQSVAFSDGATPTAGGQGDAVYYPLDGTGPLAGAPTPGSGDCAGCAMTEFVCEVPVACPATQVVDGTAASVCTLGAEITDWQALVEATDGTGAVTVVATAPATTTIVYSETSGYSATDFPSSGWDAEPTGAHSGAGCADETQTTYAYVICDITGDGETADDVVTAVGSIAITYFAPAQAPTITNDATCAYTYVAACAGDVFDPATIPDAAPGEDPAAFDVTVTTANGCMATFSVDPPACPVDMTCAITDLVVTPTACDPMDDTYDLDIAFTVTNPGVSGMFNVDVCGTAYGPFAYSALPINIPDLPADGTMGCTVTVTDADNTGGGTGGTVVPTSADDVFVSFVPDGAGSGGGIDECDTESVTIHNFATDASGACVTIDISDFTLTDNVGVFYTFPAGTTIPPGGSLTLTSTQMVGPCSGTAGMGDGGGSQFGNSNDNALLSDAAGAAIDDTGSVDGDPGTEYESPALTAAGGAGSAVCGGAACEAAMPYDAPASCLAACPMVTTPLATAEELCDGGAPVLDASTLVLDDPTLAQDGTGNVVVTWYTDAALTTVFGGTVAHSGGDNCATEDVILYAAIECIATPDPLIAAGQTTITVYPSYDATTLTITNADCTVATVVSSCGNYVITPDPANPAAPGPGMMATFNFTVEYNGGPAGTSCFSEVEMVNVNCPAAGCPSVTPVDATDAVCDGSLAAEITTWQGNVEADATVVAAIADANTDAAVIYSTDAPAAVSEATPPTPGTATGVHSGADLCAAETQMTFAYLLCFGDDGVAGGGDDSYLALGMNTLTVYPLSQAPTIADDPATCIVTITPACANDVLSQSNLDYNGAMAGALDVIGATAQNEFGCPAVTYDVTHGDCTVAMPSIMIVKDDADNGDDTQEAVGGSATFTITIMNNGDEDLCNIVLTDTPSDAGVVVTTCEPTFTSIDSNADGTLAVGETETYTCTVTGITAAFTNSIAVTAEGCGSGTAVMDDDPTDVTVPMVCEDEIAGMVVADPSCDLSNITVTITDAAGTVITTLMTDAAGIYDSTPAVFPCGDYFAELTAGVPACYGDGETGPKPFIIDGDTSMTDTDGPDFGTTIASIPTVGEWGLIILALLMSIVAVVGIRERKASEVNA